MTSTATRPLVTPSGRQKLRHELDHLEKRLRESEKRLQQELQHKDDLHWDLTQQEINQMRTRLAQLKSVFEDEPVAFVPSSDGVVKIGGRVTVRDETGCEHSYVIVAPIENDASKGFISFESPVGAALIGRRPGDFVNVLVPKGERRLSVLSAE